MDKRALGIAIVAGTLAQVAMVILGHMIPAVASLFAVGGMGLSFLAGLLFSAQARPSLGAAALGGAVAGGLCALLGIAVSLVLRDVTTIVLVIGAISSAVTGAIGGCVGRLLVRRQNA